MQRFSFSAKAILQIGRDALSDEQDAKQFWPGLTLRAVGGPQAALRDGILA